MSHTQFVWRSALRLHSLIHGLSPCVPAKGNDFVDSYEARQTEHTDSIQELKDSFVLLCNRCLRLAGTVFTVGESLIAYKVNTRIVLIVSTLSVFFCYFSSEKYFFV
jgi:hypothetical protein